MEDLKAVIIYIMECVKRGEKIKVCRREAVKKRAYEKNVTVPTIMSNITRGFGITTDQLDEIISEIIKCLLQ